MLELSQRNLDGGLIPAAPAYAISDEDARRLIPEGYRLEACGRDVVPEKTIVFVDPLHLSSIESRCPIPVGLGPDFLTASAIALVAFDDSRR